MFAQYKRKAIAELRPVTEDECKQGTLQYLEGTAISISQVDLDNGSPKIGDMIAQNPENHDDQWLVAAKYFEDNFEKVL